MIQPEPFKTMTVEEARQVADQIRTAPRGGSIDRAYWSYTIEQLCDRLEEMETAPSLVKSLPSEALKEQPREPIRKPELAKAK